MSKTAKGIGALLFLLPFIVWGLLDTQSCPGHENPSTSDHQAKTKCAPAPCAESKDEPKASGDAQHDKISLPPAKEWTCHWVTSLVDVFTYWIFLVTAFLAYYTYKLWDQTKALSEGADASAQSTMTKMGESIAEAARSAAAMENLAKSAAANTALARERSAQQMRAYLTVSINTGFYQNSAIGLKFAVHPMCFNSGQTPAHKMRYWAKADICPFPLPDDFDFPPIKNPVISAFSLGPHHGIELNAVCDNFIRDQDVQNVKDGISKRVFIWGVITYDDIFGDTHETKFCHSLYWIGNPLNPDLRGTYSATHNEAT